MDKIYYLGFYDTPENKEEKRNIVLAATNKMAYIIEAIEKTGYSAEVISASQTKNKKSYAEKIIPIGQKSSLHLFKTSPWGNKIRRVISVLYLKYQYRQYILKNITANDTVIAYHAVPYAEFLARAKKKLGFKLILEVEEIYADVNGSENDRKKEYKVFEAADAYIFPTKMLDDKLNTQSKPSVIIHGTYKVEPDRKAKFNDDKIHIVYAGTFDPRKGGALAAVGAAEFLDDKYHLHIIGFGNSADKQNVLNEMERVSKTTECTVTFDGLLSGEDYIRFIQSCDIGLSTQNPTGAYNDTSFPSKILSYMANGLRVVSVKIPVIETSAIGEYMYYYDEQTTKKIAEAIKSAAIDGAYNSRAEILKLNEKFISELKNLLGD